MSNIRIALVPRAELWSHRQALADTRARSVAECDSELRFMDWWYFQGPARGGAYAGAFDGNRLVAGVGYGIHDFVFDGRTVRASILSNAITHPSYRGKGLFSKLILALIEASRQEGAEAVLGWPNPTALKIYKRLGFTELFRPIQLIRPIAWSSIGLPFGQLGTLATNALGNLIDRSLERSGKDYVARLETPPDDELMELMSGAARPHIDRNGDYLSWRLANPDTSYLQLTVRDGAKTLRAWGALRRPGPEGSGRVRIGCLVCPNPSRKALAAFLSGCLRQARHLGATELGWMGRYSYLCTLFGSLGLLMKPTVTPLVGVGVRGAISRFVSWDYQEMDSDVF